MKLIQIGTDGDFSISYHGEILRQQNETIFIVVQKEQCFIDAVYQGCIKASSGFSSLLFDMANNGEGCYGNYSYSIDEYTPFVHRLVDSDQGAEEERGVNDVDYRP